jgi:hypothetical protein
MRWRDKSPPADIRRMLVDLTEEQLAILGEKRNQLVADWDEQ